MIVIKRQLHVHLIPQNCTAVSKQRDDLSAFSDGVVSASFSYGLDMFPFSYIVEMASFSYGLDLAPI